MTYTRGAAVGTDDPMANPQQPELRRSGRVPALDPDASEAKLSAQDRPQTGDVVGDAPPEQQPGHRPEQDQDKPDLDKFAARLGVKAEGDEPHDAPNVTEAEGVGQSRWQSQWRRVLVPVAVLGAIAAVGIRIRRSR